MTTISQKELKSPGVIEVSSGRLSFAESVTSEGNKDFVFPILFKISAMFICSKGAVSVVINDKKVYLEKGSLLVITPNSVIESIVEEESPCGISVVMIAGEDHFRSIVIDRMLWDLMVKIRKDPVIKLDDEEVLLISEYRNLVIHLLSARRGDTYREAAMNSLTDAFLYEFLNILTYKVSYEPHEEDKIVGKRLFLSFLDSVQKGEGKIHSVDDLAEELCVSPKYLARVVKENSGMTPSDWMDEYTMRAIIHNLRHTDKPMKEIAIIMGFPNPSSFGAFFKRHTGISPGAFRQKSK